MNSLARQGTTKARGYPGSVAHVRWALGVCVGLTLVFLATVQALATDPLGTLSADRHTITWRPTIGDPIRGTHSNRGLESAVRRELAAVFRDEGLFAAGVTIPPESLALSITGASADYAEIVFERVGTSPGAGDLLWFSERAAHVPAGDVWFADVVVFDAGCSVDGEIIGSLVALGGDVAIGEGATIRGDVVVLGGVLRQKRDAKIYGNVFAPGGHRRPRLLVPSAGELEEEGYEWRPTISYDRVDGLRLGARGAVQNRNAATYAALWTGYALASETWQFQFEVRQRLLSSGLLEAAGSAFRLTTSDDEAVVGRNENTAFAVVAGSDYRDYYGEDGGEVAVKMRYRDVGAVTLAYRYSDYRHLDAERNLWHLFRSDRDFRRNFSTIEHADSVRFWLPGNSSSARLTVRIAPVVTGSQPIGFNGWLEASYEVAGGLLGGCHDYDRITLLGQGWWDSGRWHRVTLRAFYGSARRTIPPNKWFYSGGIGTLRGYSQKIFSGNQSFIGNMEYHFTYWENPLGDAAIILFADVGRTTFEGNFWDPDEFMGDVGIGFDFGETFRLDAALALDTPDRDIKVTVRLARPW